MEVEVGITVEDLKCLLEIETMIPVNDQAIFFRNTELNQDGKKLVDCGVSNNDMLSLTRAAGVMQRSGNRRNLSGGDKNLLDSFFTSLTQDVSRIPKMNFS